MQLVVFHVLFLHSFCVIFNIKVSFAYIVFSHRKTGVPHRSCKFNLSILSVIFSLRFCSSCTFLVSLRRFICIFISVNRQSIK